MWLSPKKYNTNTFGAVLRNLLITGSILILLILLYFYLYLPAATNHGESITVPNIEGMHVDELENFLVKRNLRWEINDSSYSEKYPSLTVLKQFPGAGSKVKENRVIFISINSVNPPTVPVPNLIDGTVTNAEAVLRASELKRGRIELVRGPYHFTVKAMKFKGRPLQPNERVPKGSVIDLVVNDGGSNEMPIPDLDGMSLEDAKLLIFGLDLNLGHVEIVGDTAGTGPVIVKQKPEAHDNMKVGDIVDLWIGAPGTEVPEE